MTLEELNRAMHPDRVFEVSWLKHLSTWRAFYRTRRHFDNPRWPASNGCEYRSVDNPEFIGAVEQALAACVKERLND